MLINDDYKYIRKKLHLTQKQMAKLLDCALVSVQKYEAGKSTPAGDIMYKYVSMAVALELGYRSSLHTTGRLYLLQAIDIKKEEA